MPRYVALLRSVNVAGHGRIAMNELRASFEDLKYRDVTTYIQTGNVLFSTGSKSEATIVAAIEQRLAEEFGDSPAVILRTVPDLLRIGTASPYQKAGANPSRHHVTFLATKPAPEVLRALALPPAAVTNWSSTAGRSTCTPRTVTRRRSTPARSSSAGSAS